MAEPMVHASQSRAGVEEVRRDRVLEHLEVSLARGGPACFPEVCGMKTSRLATHTRNSVRLARVTEPHPYVGA
jgi:hypothetical protein